MSEVGQAIEGAFKNLVETSTEAELSMWIAHGLAQGDFTPIALSREPIEEAQLQDLFEQLTDGLRNRFRKATCLALSAWNPGVDGSILIQRLAILAAFIREPCVVDHVRRIITHELLDSFEDESKFQILQILIGVSGEFAPLRSVQALFERLFMSPGLDHRLAAQLFLGLCICKPWRYTEYVPRLIQILHVYGGYYRLDYLMAEMVRIVTLSTIARRFQHLDRQVGEVFLQHLCEFEWSPARTCFDSQGRLCIASKQGFRALGDEYRSDSAEYPLFPPGRLDEYARAMTRRTVFVRVAGHSAQQNILGGLAEAKASWPGEQSLVRPGLDHPAEIYSAPTS